VVIFHDATARSGPSKPPVSPPTISEPVPILVDTGVLLGAIDADDAAHTRCAALLDVHAPGLPVPVTVIADAAWQLENNVGVEAEAALLDSVITGELTVVDITAADYVRAVELIRRYADLGLGLVDASAIAIAERLNVTTIATLDRRDFTDVRPAHRDTFELVP
jgi:predicted nucleic acid-binding protein